jgi:hypothetical protein
MATFQIQASWNYDNENSHVNYTFSRRQPGRTNPDTTVWHHLGDEQGPLCTAKQAEVFAMAWLTEHAGMTDTDSTRMHLFTSGAIEQIEALAASAR